MDDAPQPGGWGAYREQAGGVAINRSGTIAYTLANTYDKGYYILAASLGTPTPRTVRVAVTNPARYGYATKFTVIGTPSTVAALTIHNNGTGANTRVNVAIGSTGVAAYSRVLTYSGTAAATIAADLTHTGYASAAVAYRVPSLMTVSMSKPAKLVRGVYYYARATYARQIAAIRAVANGRAVYAYLYRVKIGSHTWAHIQSAVLHTTSTGAVYTYMASMSKGYYYKITYSFRGDTYNGASTGTTKVFRLS